MFTLYTRPGGICPVFFLSHYYYCLNGAEQKLPVPGAEDEEIKLRDNIVSKLREQGIFKDVRGAESTDEAMCELHMVATIIKLRRVSKQSRGTLGIFSGRASIMVETRLQDRSTGQKLCTFQIEGRSSNHSVLAGTTDQAIDKAAVQVENYIKNQKHIGNSIYEHR